MALQHCIVEVNSSAVSRGLLSVRTCGRDFFDQAVFGGPPSERAASKQFRLHVRGIDEPIITDMVSDSSGRLRWTFRDRTWVKTFIQNNGLVVGDKLFIIRTGPFEYRLSPLWRQFTFIDLFAGIGGMRLAFEAVRGKCVFSSEIDPLAQKTYEANFGEKPSGDITEISPHSIPDHDILLAGFPCQAFSIIGNRRGFADVRGTLFFNIQEILKAKRPQALLLENVKQLRTHDNGRTYDTVIKSLHELGYHTHTEVLNALDYGVPQKRERTFIVGFLKNLDFSFPKPFGYRPSLDSVLEQDDKVDPKLFASEYIKKKRLSRLERQGVEPFYPSMWHENKGGYIGMHPFSCALRANASYNYLLVNGYRRPSSRECLRLQGYPENFKIVLPHPAIRWQAGNSVAVPLITAIASHVVESLRKDRVIRDSLFDDLIIHKEARRVKTATSVCA